MLLIFSAVSCTENIQVKKQQEEALRNVGEAYMAQGDYTAALKEFLRAKEIYPEDPVLYDDLGLAYMAKEKLDLAIIHFKKAVSLNPDYAPARNNLGTAYLAKKQWDAAITCFKELTENLLYATPSYPLSNLGWAYYNKREFARAEKYYKAALKKRPGFIIALRGLGRTYLALGRISNAVATLEKAVQISPKRPELHFDLAGAYALSRNYKKAFKAYMKTVALAPDSPLAQSAKKEAEKIKFAR